MSIWEAFKADPFAWVPIVLLASFLALGAWRVVRWLVKR